MSTSAPSQSPSGGDWFDYLVIGVVLLAIGFAAAAFGGVEPWSEAILTGLSSLLLVASCVQVARGRVTRRLTAPAMILTVFAVYLLLQVAPLPHSLIAWLSPQRLLAQQQAQPGEEIAPWLTLSYYPLATSHGLRMYLIGVSIFASVSTTVAGPSRLKVLLLGVFAIGSAEAALAIAQIVTKAKGIYWSELSFGHLRSGSFIHHSNFAQFLNLTAGSGLALCLVRLSEKRYRRRVKGSPPAAIGQLLQENWWLFAGLVLHALAIAGSLSRGGLLGMVVATLGVTSLLHRQKGLSWQAWTLFAIPPLVFGGAMLIGFDAIYDRLATLERQDSYSDRIELGAASLRTAWDHVILGAGLDAYQYVFPQYDTTMSASLAEQADNDYAQLLVETGLVGVVLVGGFLLVLSRVISQRLSSLGGHLHYAFYGITYAFLAIAVQCVTDFGQRLPAVFGVSALLCGAVFATPKDSQEQKAWPLSSQLGLAAALLTTLTPLVVWSINEAARDYQAEVWFTAAREIELQIDTPRSEATVQDYVDLVAAAEQAAELRPDSLTYAFWLNRYRWRLVLATNNGDEQAAVATPDAREVVLQIADQLKSVRRLCPTYGPAYTTEGELRMLAGDDTGRQLVLRGAELYPNSPRASLAAIRVMLASGGIANEAVQERLAHCVAIKSDSYAEAAAICVKIARQPSWASELAGYDIRRLSILLGLLEESGEYPDLATKVAKRIEATQEQRVVDGDASASECVALAQRRANVGEHTEAVRLYRQALATNYSHIVWRLSLADSLIALERYAEAEREARIAMRIQPANAKAREKLEQISLLTPAGDTISTPE